MNTPIPNRHAIQQLEQTLQSLGATLVPQADKPDAKNLLTHAQQTCQQLDQVLCDHLTVLREAELALSCVLTLLLRHDEHPFPGRQIRVLLEPFQQQMEVALHGLEGLR